MKEIGAKLRSLLGAEAVKPQEPLSRHTTFRIGGPAEWFAAPADEASFCQAVRLCRQEGIPWYVIGNGSNLLADDAGFGGVVLSTEGLCGCRIEGTEAAAGAGILLSRLARQAAERSLTGLEFAAGIPGTLGGAVVMNAGAIENSGGRYYLFRQGISPAMVTPELAMSMANSVREAPRFS